MPSKKPRSPKKGIQVRIDANMSERAERVFRAIGLDTPTAIRMFFAKVAVTGGIPFPVQDDSYTTYTPQQMREIEKAYKESFEQRNVRGPFVSAKAMLEDMRQHRI
ncbi:type II toxin-antitoxin system RelB/DinJ family antitoxin [Candidatus Peregrinibacteria bacterium]|nr:type II toxin-antitoxin system RelB/DinJ family antitoxin [Candidatus Peregrinibacteria bacterium]